MSKHLHVKITGDAVVVRFLDKQLVQAATVQAVMDELSQLVEQGDHRKIVLNFECVEYLSSAVLGRLINLHKRFQTLNGTLTMINLGPQIDRFL